MEPKIRLKGFSGEWEEKPLLDVVTLYNGLTYTPSDIRDRGTLVLRSSNVQEGEIALFDNVYVKSDVATSPNVKKGDIIVVVRNGSRALIGKHAHIKEDMPNTVIGAFMSGMHTDEPEFMNALLSTSSFDDEVNINLGATINQITNGTFRSMKFHFPKKDEQKAIGAYFQYLESMIQSTTKKIESLKQVKVASLQAMFPQEGETTPRIRFKGFEGEWNCVEFGSIITECLDKTTIEDEDILLSSAIDGVYLNSELFGHFRGKSNIGYRKLKKNMLILSAQNLHLGNANVNLRFEHGIVSPAYKIYYIHDCNPELLSHWIKREETKKFFLDATTAGASACRKNIVWEDLYKQTLYLPKDELEQQKLASYLTSLTNQITLQTKRLEKLKQIKSACLDNMFV